MKIALVTPYDYPYPGGVTEHIRHLDREFRARGHDTRIIAPSTERQTALDANVIKVTDDVLPVPLNGSTARLTLSPDVPRRVQEILNRERFDIIHLHEPAAPLVCLSTLYYSSAVNVGTFHAYSEHNALYEHAWPFMEWVKARLDGPIFVSPAVRDSVTSYVSGEYRVIPNGIDYARFAARDISPVAEFDDGRPSILFVGRLDELKGFQHLLHAFTSIKHTIPEARLLVVGAFGEQDTAHLTEYVRTQDLRDVHFIGRVSPEELPRFYRSATVFCAPSTGGESFGIVLLEAMAASLPVIASDIAGYRSVIKHGAEGLLVGPGDEKALADSIVAVLQDSRRRARMAARGHVTAARYDWKAVAPRVLDYYEELIRSRAHRRVANPHAPATPIPSLNQEVNGVNKALGYLMDGLTSFSVGHLL
jgi:phosphatidylinositol alpha-mannosyltransferase